MTCCDETVLRISISCHGCGAVVTMEAHEKDLAAWRDGTLIQNALPYLTRDQREMLMTRMCGECFSKLFPPPPDADDTFCFECEQPHGLCTCRESALDNNN